LERRINDQLSNSYEGVKLVKESVFYIFNRFEQLINEIKEPASNEMQVSLGIQIHRRDAPTFSVQYPGIIALGPDNANVEIGYANKSANRTIEDKLATNRRGGSISWVRGPGPR